MYLLQDDLNATSNRVTTSPELLDTFISTTMVQEHDSNVNQTCVTPANTRPTSSHDALLYIVVVLLFYACSMVILMIKYVRREKEEAEMAHYYNEYVARERFKSPKYQIQQFMKRIPKPVVRKEEISEDYEDFVSCLNEDIGDNSEINNEIKTALTDDEEVGNNSCDVGNITKVNVANCSAENVDQRKDETTAEYSNLRKEK